MCVCVCDPTVSLECCHAVYVLINALALTWLTWKSEMEPAPDCSALVDKSHREDRDERVQNCLGETLWMAGDHCT